MTQRELFPVPDLRTLSRKTDPPSSHAAAERVTRSGKRDTHKRIVLEALRRDDGATSAELSKAIWRTWQANRVSGGRLEWLDRTEVARRLPDLLKAGLVRQGELRRCRINNTPAITWWINA